MIFQKFLETNFIRAVSRNSAVLTRFAQICCFGNFRNTISLKKLKRYGSPKMFRKLPKHCLFYGFMQNLFIEGHKMLLQKFPKEFLYCPRYLLKTVTKNTASEISETTFINKGCRGQISPKDGHKLLLQKFPKQFL